MPDREQVGERLIEAQKLTNHSEYVIIGSLSVLGALASPPKSMVMSVDVDLYPRLDLNTGGQVNSKKMNLTPFFRPLFS